ncbi:hypothetical protein GCM10011613_24720 [Cellvibrio zantedeschiae]|uniref:Uncharacterized protein n=1 Tax=Cellvibrio zantedeschiae TaxID=1237077 RepID=A0ABQ3B449_9GAMM|nr:hypothetical protein [Cellvibrio zantedeschiae]GGY78997.1 hypothetical protein GCM10011613_24720 [Cellvibrio zantedeschiae]
MTYLEPIAPKQNATEKPYVDNVNVKNDFSPEQNFVLSEREAEAASPEAMAVCGEEDPGEGLEFLVTEDSRT